MVDACIADAVNSQYEDKGPFAERVKEERGVIVNIASVVANPVPARCITYGASKSESSAITTPTRADRQLPFLVSRRVWPTSWALLEFVSVRYHLQLLHQA